MPKPEEWQVKAICPKCKIETLMLFHTDNHERDSSGDWYRCLNCNEHFPTGMTGQYIEEVD